MIWFHLILNFIYFLSKKKLQNIQIRIAGLCWRPPPVHAPLSQSWFSSDGRLGNSRGLDLVPELGSLDRELGSSESAVVSPTGSALRLTDGRSAGEEHLLAAEGRLRKNYPHFGFFSDSNTYPLVQINVTLLFSVKYINPFKAPPPPLTIV